MVQERGSAHGMVSLTSSHLTSFSTSASQQCSSSSGLSNLTTRSSQKPSLSLQPCSFHLFYTQTSLKSWRQSQSPLCHLRLTLLPICVSILLCCNCSCLSHRTSCHRIQCTLVGIHSVVSQKHHLPSCRDLGFIAPSPPSLPPWPIEEITASIFYLHHLLPLSRSCLHHLSLQFIHAFLSWSPQFHSCFLTPIPTSISSPHSSQNDL